MTEEKEEEMLGVIEVQEIAQKFFAEQYPDSKAFFSSARLTTVSNITVYELKGELTIGGTEVAKPTKRKFAVHVHPIQGKILGYKM